MIYLASPYSDPDGRVRIQRFEAVCRAAAKLMCEGEHVYAPIVHSHPIHVMGNDVPWDWNFWEKYDRWYLERVDKIVVLKLPGWDHSVGVQAEIRIANELRKPVEYMDV